MKVFIICLIIVLLLFGFSGFMMYQAAWNPRPDKAVKGKKHVLCIGDSITFGAGVFPHNKTQSYPAYLSKLLSDEYQVINLGLSGRTLLSTGDVPYTREKNYVRSFQIEDPVYILMLGTNDAKPYNWDEESYERELRIFLKKYIAHAGKDKVNMMTLPQAFEEAFDIKKENVAKAVEIIRRLGNELNINVIDLYDYTMNHSEWFKDGIHPNEIGNKEIAQYIYDHLFF